MTDEHSLGTVNPAGLLSCIFTAMSRHCLSLLLSLCAAASAPALRPGHAARSAAPTPDIDRRPWQRARRRGDHPRRRGPRRRARTLNYRDIQRAIKALYATGQFDDVQIDRARPPAAAKAIARRSR